MKPQHSHSAYMSSSPNSQPTPSPDLSRPKAVGQRSMSGFRGDGLAGRRFEGLPLPPAVQAELMRGTYPLQAQTPVIRPGRGHSSSTRHPDLRVDIPTKYYEPDVEFRPWRIPQDSKRLVAPAEKDDLEVALRLSMTHWKVGEWLKAKDGFESPGTARIQRSPTSATPPARSHVDDAPPTASLLGRRASFPPSVVPTRFQVHPDVHKRGDRLSRWNRASQQKSDLMGRRPRTTRAPPSSTLANSDSVHFWTTSPEAQRHRPLTHGVIPPSPVGERIRAPSFEDSRQSLRHLLKVDEEQKRVKEEEMRAKEERERIKDQRLRARRAARAKGDFERRKFHFTLTEWLLVPMKCLFCWPIWIPKVCFCVCGCLRCVDGKGWAA